MKNILYWEAKRQTAERLLKVLLESPDEGRHIPRVPPPLGNKWPAAMHRWRMVQHRILRHRREVQKVRRRLAYVESRIAILTPTFWEYL